jgi:hydroxyacylglutathione hydrolase
VLFRQVLHPDLGCASYVIADTAAGVGAVVDPKWDIADYLALAAEHDFRITDVVETHNHADHRSGRPQLVEATGARSWVHPLAEARYPHEPFADGAEIEVGAVRLRALHVPGHRPEHTAVVVIDRSRSDVPCAVLTGDSLFVHDVARPDLAIEKREGAAQLYHAVQRLLELDDGVEVFPGHTGGSLCGSARMSETTSSTIGYERASNPMLQLAGEEQFVAELIEGLPPQPPNFKGIAESNRLGERPADGAPVPLSAEALAERIDAGALVVDGRPSEDYDDGHIPGTVGVAVSVSGFGTRVAWIARPGADLILVAADDGEAAEMTQLLGSVGLAPTGVLAGGVAAWAAAGRPLERFETVAARDLAVLAEARGDLQILDVREEYEWAEGHIPGSAHLPYHDIARVAPQLDRDRPVAVICSTGRRAAMAVGLVRRAGFAEVVHVVRGGVGTWAGQGNPIERSQPAAV